MITQQQLDAFIATGLRTSGAVYRITDLHYGLEIEVYPHAGQWRTTAFDIGDRVVLEVQDFGDRRAAQDYARRASAAEVIAVRLES